jgi:oligopeptide transport system permease protein
MSLTLLKPFQKSRRAVPAHVLLREDNPPEALDASLFVPAVYDGTAAEKAGYSNYSYWRSTFRMFGKNKMAMFFLGVLIVMLLFTFIQPLLPYQKSPTIINNDPVTGYQLRNIQPNSEYWFGTNSIGQDLWSRLWAGTRTSLFIGVAVAFFEALIGILMGAVWGYVRRLDRIFTEIYNVLDNIPTTIIRILITYIMRPSLFTVTFVMCLTGWMDMARFIRNQIVIIRDREYNLASRCLGTPTSQIISKNLLPYLVSVIMLRTALAVPGAIGTEVFLTYIGLGLPVDIPALGNLINEGRQVMLNPTMTYQLIFPAVAVSIITVSFYMIGNGFSDAADPRNHV